MLVCPNCRSDNQEDSRFCTTCGRSLSPDEAAMVARPRREEAEPEMDIPAPREYSPLPGILTLAVIALAAIGVTTWFLLRPNPCEGKFTSDRFPYCVTVPSSWQAQQVQLQSGQTLDAFVAPQQDGARVYVLAEEAGGLNTQTFTEESREQLRSDGLFPTPPEPVDVDGVQGFSWEVTQQSEATGTLVTENRVTLVRDGMRWVIVLLGPQPDVERSLPEFQDMLETWSWK